MKKKTIQKLALKKSTVSNLEYPASVKIKGGASSPCMIDLSKKAGCMSPLCMPTFWETCEQVQATQFPQ